MRSLWYITVGKLLDVAVADDVTRALQTAFVFNIPLYGDTAQPMLERHHQHTWHGILEADAGATISGRRPFLRQYHRRAFEILALSNADATRSVNDLVTPAAQQLMIFSRTPCTCLLQHTQLAAERAPVSLDHFLVSRLSTESTGLMARGRPCQPQGITRWRLKVYDESSASESEHISEKSCSNA